MNRESIELIYQYSKHYGNILYECESLYKEGRRFILSIRKLRNKYTHKDLNQYFYEYDGTL